VLLVVTLVALGLAQVVIGMVVPRISRAAKQAQEAVGVMSAALERALGNLRTVKASGAEERERERLHEAAAAAWQGGVRAAKWEAVAGNTGGLAVQLSFIVVLGLGGARVVSGAIDVGTLVAFLLYLYYLMPPMRDLAHVAAQYQVGAAAIGRIREIEQLPTEPGDPAPPASGGSPAGVAFEQVRFRYRPELPEVHHGVTFTVPPGGTTAFVGPSGAGKTTVFSLLERFYEPTSGRSPAAPGRGHLPARRAQRGRPARHHRRRRHHDHRARRRPPTVHSGPRRSHRRAGHRHGPRHRHARRTRRHRPLYHELATTQLLTEP